MNNKPEKTASSWTKDGWFRSGDIMYRDEDGYFFLRPRRRHAQGRRNVGSTVRNRVRALAAHPAVIEAAVIGVPDDNQLIKPKAFCVLRNPEKAGPDLAQELIQFTKQRITKNGERENPAL